MPGNASRYTYGHESLVQKRRKEDDFDDFVTSPRIFFVSVTFPGRNSYVMNLKFVMIIIYKKILNKSFIVHKRIYKINYYYFIIQQIVVFGI